MRTIRYETTEEFDKDLKKLLKKFPTLMEDLQVVKRNAIELLHLRNIDNDACFEIPNYCLGRFNFHKVKKFACKSLKGKGVMSGIRLIYVFFPGEYRIVLHEIYYKGVKDDMDYNRATYYKDKYLTEINSLV